MQIDGKIASVYASALFELTQDNKSSDKDLLEIESELSSLAVALTGDAKIWSYLSSPISDPDEKQSLIDRCLKGKVSDLLNDFLKTLARRRRVDVLPGVVTAFGGLVDEKVGRKHATIKTAKKLNESDLEAIKKSLSSYFKKEIIVEEEVVPELIGGLVINTGDIVIDSSVSRKLKQINKAMKEHKIFGEKFYEN